MIIKFTLAQLEQKAKSRPQGYKDDILKAAKLSSDGIYELPEEEFKALAEKYRTPTLASMIASATEAAVDLIKNGITLRTEDEVKNILAICSKCPFLLVDDKKCAVCGCFLPLKSQFENFHCPESKW